MLENIINSIRDWRTYGIIEHMHTDSKIYEWKIEKYKRKIHQIKYNIDEKSVARMEKYFSKIEFYEDKMLRTKDKILHKYSKISSEEIREELRAEKPYLKIADMMQM